MIGGPRKGMYLEGASLRWMMGKEGWKKEGHLGGLGEWSILHLPWLVAGSTFQGLSSLPSRVTLSLVFLGPFLLATTVYSHLQLPVPPSVPAPPLILASWKDPGSGQSAIQE